MRLKTLATWCAALALCTAGAASAAPPTAEDGLATFTCKGKRCDDEGNWRFIDGSSRIVKEKGHGKPRFFLFMDGPEFIPWAQTDMGGDSPFHGDYRARGVSSLLFDARTDGVEGGFCQPPAVTQRQMSVELRNDGGTPGDESDDCGVLANLGLIPQVDEGYVTYELLIPSDSPTLPEGFAVSFAGGGCSGLSADEAWNLVMEDVSQVRICWEQCDFLSIECIWKLSLDNVEIVGD